MKKGKKKLKNIRTSNEKFRGFGVCKVSVVTIIVGVLESVTHNFKKFMEQLGIELETHFVQKSTLLGTAKILRRVLQY